MSRHHVNRPQWRAIRLAVLQRDGWTYQNPDRGRQGGIFEVHHIIHLDAGGTDDLANLRALCRGCHQDIHRPTRTPEQAAWDAYVARLAG